MARGHRRGPERKRPPLDPGPGRTLGGGRAVRHDELASGDRHDIRPQPVSEPGDRQRGRETRQRHRFERSRKARIEQQQRRSAASQNRYGDPQASGARIQRCAGHRRDRSRKVPLEGGPEAAGPVAGQNMERRGTPRSEDQVRVAVPVEISRNEPVRRLGRLQRHARGEERRLEELSRLPPPDRGGRVGMDRVFIAAPQDQGSRVSDPVAGRQIRDAVVIEVRAGEGQGNPGLLPVENPGSVRPFGEVAAVRQEDPRVASAPGRDRRLARRGRRGLRQPGRNRAVRDGQEEQSRNEEENGEFRHRTGSLCRFPASLTISSGKPSSGRPLWRPFPALPGNAARRRSRFRPTPSPLSASRLCRDFDQCPGCGGCGAGVTLNSGSHMDTVVSPVNASGGAKAAASSPSRDPGAAATVSS